VAGRNVIRVVEEAEAGVPCGQQCRDRRPGSGFFVGDNGGDGCPAADRINQYRRNVGEIAGYIQDAVVHGGVQDAVHPALQECFNVCLPGFRAGRHGSVDDQEVVAAGTCGVVRAKNDPARMRRGGDVLTDQAKQPGALGAQRLGQAVGAVAELHRRRLHLCPGLGAYPRIRDIIQDVGHGGGRDSGSDCDVLDADVLVAQCSPTCWWSGCAKGGLPRETAPMTGARQGSAGYS